VNDAQEQDRLAARGLDVTVPNVARIYDYILGGKDNFEADREVGEQTKAAYPDIVSGVRAQRAFLASAVRYLVTQRGVRQFLDIGTGLPVAENTHEVAQSLAPESRVVYVDNDPMVLAHARALLTSAPEGACAYLDADIRDTGNVLRAASGLLDFGQPIAVMLIGILHLIPDADDPAGIVGRLVGALPPGSWLAVAHPASDVAGQGRHHDRPLQPARHHRGDAAHPRGDLGLLRRHGAAPAWRRAVPPVASGRARPRRRGRGGRVLRPRAQALEPQPGRSSRWPARA